MSRVRQGIAKSRRKGEDRCVDGGVEVVIWCREAVVGRKMTVGESVWNRAHVASWVLKIFFVHWLCGSYSRWMWLGGWTFVVLDQACWF